MEGLSIVKGKKTRVIRFDRYGEADVFRIDEIPLAEPGPDEVRIRVEALSLNRADALFRRNTYFIDASLPASRIGNDAAGIVEAAGENVTHVAVGDRVFSWIGFDVSKYGVHGETAILPAAFVVKYPDFLSSAEAASIAAPYTTVWGALIDLGQMSEGDFVVITAASSSVGVAAIQAANSVGAIPIAVTRRESKRGGLSSVGAAHVIVSDSESISERVAEITNGKGARLIFDPIAVGMLDELTASAAVNGTIFLYGTLGDDRPLGTVPTLLPLMSTLGKQLSVRGYSNYHLAADSSRLQNAVDWVFEGLRSGNLKVPIARTFSFEEYADAHRYLESNEQIGRVVVELNP